MNIFSRKSLRYWYIFVAFFALFAPTIASLLGQDMSKSMDIPTYIAVTVIIMYTLLDVDNYLEQERKDEMK